MGRLEERVLELNRSGALVSPNLILSNIDLDIIRKMDHAEATDAFIKAKRRELLNLFKVLDIEYRAEWDSIRTILFEVETYFLFIPRYPIVPVPRSKISGEKTPDFKLLFHLINYYVECKSFSWPRPVLSIPADQNAAVESAIELEAQRLSGEILCEVMRAVNPYKSSTSPVPEYLQPVFTIMEKIFNNADEGQLSNDHTILFLDLSLLTLLERAEESLFQWVQNPKVASTPWTGALWAICCGWSGMEVTAPKAHIGNSQLTALLRYNGIFRTFDKVNAVVFKPWADRGFERAVAIVRENCTEEKYLLDSLAVKSVYGS